MLTHLRRNTPQQHLRPSCLRMVENLKDFRLLEVAGHKQKALHRVIKISKQLEALGIQCQHDNQGDVINPKNKHQLSLCSEKAFPYYEEKWH